MSPSTTVANFKQDVTRSIFMWSWFKFRVFLDWLPHQGFNLAKATSLWCEKRKTTWEIKQTSFAIRNAFLQKSVENSNEHGREVDQYFVLRQTFEDLAKVLSNQIIV